MTSLDTVQDVQPQRRPRQWRLLHASAAITVTLTIIGGGAFSPFVIGEMEGEISVRVFGDVILS